MAHKTISHYFGKNLAGVKKKDQILLQGSTVL